MAHVFISYSKQDIAFGRHLRGMLQNADIPVWMDETALVPSERWWKRIEDNIRSCAAFVVIMSPNSLASDWVEREILLAEKLRKPIFPLLLAGEPWSRLANIQYVSVEKGLDAELPEALIDALKQDVAASPPTAVPPPLPGHALTDGTIPDGPDPDAPPQRLPVGTVVALAAALLVVLVLVVPRLLPVTPTPTPTETVTPNVTPAATTPVPGGSATPSGTPLLPNLTVGRLRVSPRVPAPGQIFILSITLLNTGGTASGPFNWSWDASLQPPVMQNTLDGRVESIPPNGSKNISFPVSYGWWGSYTTQLRVDVDSEVAESDERDNLSPFIIDVGDVPFEVDFSLMPPNQLVEPPVRLTADSYKLWNLRFSLVPLEGVDCSNAALSLRDVDQDILLQVDTSGTDADCAASGIRIEVLRDAVGAAEVELLPTASGVASIFYYDSLFDPVTPSEPFTSITDVPLLAGVHSLLGEFDDQTDTTRSIRRLEVFADGTALRITRLVMLRQTS